MTPKGHVHSFVFFKTSRSGEKWYKCADPHCFFTCIHAMALGKNSLCPVCKEEIFTLSYRDLERKTPKCLNCSDTKEAKQHKRVKAVASQLFDTPSEEAF